MGRLTGLVAIETVWPRAIVQTCTVDLIGASLRYANHAVLAHKSARQLSRAGRAVLVEIDTAGDTGPGAPWNDAPIDDRRVVSKLVDTQ